MQQVDTIQLVPKVSTIFNRVVRFFGSSRFSTPQPDQVMTIIDWPDSDSKRLAAGVIINPSVVDITRRT